MLLDISHKYQRFMFESTISRIKINPVNDSLNGGLYTKFVAEFLSFCSLISGNEKWFWAIFLNFFCSSYNVLYNIETPQCQPGTISPISPVFPPENNV